MDSTRPTNGKARSIEELFGFKIDAEDRLRKLEATVTDIEKAVNRTYKVCMDIQLEMRREFKALAAAQPAKPLSPRAPRKAKK